MVLSQFVTALRGAMKLSELLTLLSRMRLLRLFGEYSLKIKCYISTWQVIAIDMIDKYYRLLYC
ncbi:hypothetical protein B194_3625 [Serratia plymuthica A30]|nr:hypothetical protein B194_3625 [Serratia plymuthica A30]